MRRLLVLLLAAASLGFVGRGGLPCDAVRAQPRCYVGLYPGPATNTLTAVEVGAETSPSNGELLLTTVLVDTELSVTDWIRGTLSQTIRTVPREVLFPDEVSTEEIREQNIQEMDQSQLDATIAALRALGYQVETAFDGSEIVEVLDYSAGVGILAVGDVIVGVGDRAVRSNADLGAALDRLDVGQAAVLEILRGGASTVVDVPLVASPDGGIPVLGIRVQSHLELPVDVRIDTGVVGGPSAGLMFSLAIVDLLTPADLTGGFVIAGTGVIDQVGTVGRIGGIQQKILGALDRQDGGSPAQVFLVPAGNLEEARRTPGLTRSVLLVPVDTLDQALQALADLRAGATPAGAVTVGPGGDDQGD